VAADFAVILQNNDRAAQLKTPAASQPTALPPPTGSGYLLRAAFPDAVFAREHQIGRDDPLMPLRS
jgi:hypothetical protein